MKGRHLSIFATNEGKAHLTQGQRWWRVGQVSGSDWEFMVVGKRVAPCFHKAVSQLSYDSGTAEASQRTRLADEKTRFVNASSENTRAVVTLPTQSHIQGHWKANCLLACSFLFLLYLPCHWHLWAVSHRPEWCRRVPGTPLYRSGAVCGTGVGVRASRDRQAVDRS